MIAVGQQSFSGVSPFAFTVNTAGLELPQKPAIKPVRPVVTLSIDLSPIAFTNDQEVENEYVRSKVSEQLSKSSPDQNFKNAPVLSLREILNPDNLPYELSSKKIYVIVGDSQCILVSDGPSQIITADFLDSISVNNQHYQALCIIKKFSETTNTALTSLGRRNSFMGDPSISAKAKIEILREISSSLHYISLRLDYESMAVTRIGYLIDTSTDISPEEASSCKVLIKYCSDYIKKTKSNKNSAQGRLGFKLATLELEAQEASNKIVKKLTILGGMAVPFGTSLAVIQAMQLTGGAAEGMFYFGIAASAILTGALFIPSQLTERYCGKLGMFGRIVSKIMN